MSKVVERLKEPSTHAGIASVIAGIGQILHSPETTEIASAVPDIASRLASHDYVGVGMILFGLIAIFKKEKK